MAKRAKSGWERSLRERRTKGRIGHNDIANLNALERDELLSPGLKPTAREQSSSLGRPSHRYVADHTDPSSIDFHGEIGEHWTLPVARPCDTPFDKTFWSDP